VPNEGYTFINWTENDQVVSENATYEFEVLNDLLLTANFQTALSVSDESTSEFVIYPNPVSDLLYISHPSIQNFEISIFTLNGKLVVSKSVNQSNLSPIDLSSLPAGQYIFELKTSDQRFSSKFIKK